MNELNKQAREAKNEYYRRWRAKNPEKVKESNRKYWERKARERKEQEARHATENANNL